MGYDPSTVRRGFKRHFGITFLEMARLVHRSIRRIEANGSDVHEKQMIACSDRAFREYAAALGRIRDGFETLAGGGRVIDAQLDADFNSPSGFRAAFARLLGQPPGDFAGKQLLKADWIDTPLGPMIAVSDARALHLLEFIDRKGLPTELKKLRGLAHGDLGLGRYAPTDQIEAELAEYFAGESATFTVPLVEHGSAFSRDVWHVLRQIAPGETRSYGDIAEALGRPSATRAVARANGANQIAIVIPCHRVIGADGSLTGYGGGLWRKQQLIDLERRFIR
jgi:AraC family transcriptional regulator of adaptative response/methylated-DNA-[protein]-cysteine methyltransferase